MRVVQTVAYYWPNSLAHARAASIKLTVLARVCNTNMFALFLPQSSHAMATSSTPLLLHAVKCTNLPNNPSEGSFTSGASCTNPTALQGTCTGACGTGYAGSLIATCTGPNTWTTNNQCQASRFACVRHMHVYL
jgi:hypothetical protein